MTRARHIQRIVEYYGDYGSPYPSYGGHHASSAMGHAYEPHSSYDHDASSFSLSEPKKKSHTFRNMALGAAGGAAASIGGMVAYGHHIGAQFPNMTKLMHTVVTSGKDLAQ